MLQSFTDEIKIINGNPYVRPPEKILETIFKQSGKDTSPIAVRGKINGAEYQQSLVRYMGDWRLYVNIIMANASGIKFKKSISEIVGRVTNFDIEFDPSPPTYKMLPFLQKALDENAIAKQSWQKLIPSRKKEILRYFSWLKSDEAKKRNIAKLITALMGTKIRFMARDWKEGK